MKSFIVLSVLALSAAAFASDGTSQFRLLSGASVGFSYDADMQAGAITGSISSDGTSQVNLSLARNTGIGGQLGSYVSVDSAEVSTDGVGTVSISTIYGMYDYTMMTDKKGNIEIRAMSPRDGSMLTAELTKDGKEFSVATPVLGMTLDQNADQADRYEGMAIVNNDYWNTDTADMVADGTLDLAKLAKSNPALFIVLYVLPFDMGN